MRTEVLQLAKLLGTSEKVVLDLEKKMNQASGKEGVIESIVRENEHKVRQSLVGLGFGADENFFDIQAEEVYQALIKKTKKTNQSLFEHFQKPDLMTAAGCRSLIHATGELTGNLNGFYLKKEKAEELLKLNPPKQIMNSLGYGSDIDKMIEKEDCFEIFSALRFAEDGQWLNDVFFKPYSELKKDDFEKREIKVMVLPERWTGLGKKFFGNKLHHMSHLKEAGMVFIIPTGASGPNEMLYLFFMILHYIYEVNWHSRLFEIYSKKSDFARKLVGALKVGVGEMPPSGKDEINWRIIPKYLGKKNPEDPLLAEPHINPESLHYTQAAATIEKFAQRFNDLELGFWQGLDMVAQYFPSGKSAKGESISFDLFDNGISFLRKADFNSRFLYHQKEALWNKVFSEYMGEKTINKLTMENLDKGYISL